MPTSPNSCQTDGAARAMAKARFDSPEREQARAKLNDTLRSTPDWPAEEAAGRPSVTSALADKNNEGLPHLRKPFV